MIKQEIAISDIYKKHENGVAELVSLACTFESEIHLLEGSRKINAKSIMGILAFTAEAGTLVEVTATGSDEEQAVAAMIDFLK